MVSSVTIANSGSLTQPWRYVVIIITATMHRKNRQMSSNCPPRVCRKTPSATPQEETINSGGGDGGGDGGGGRDPSTDHRKKRVSMNVDSNDSTPDSPDRRRGRTMLRRSHTWAASDRREGVKEYHSVTRLYHLVRSRSVNSVKQLIRFFEQKLVRIIC